MATNTEFFTGEHFHTDGKRWRSRRLLDPYYRPSVRNGHQGSEVAIQKPPIPFSVIKRLTVVVKSFDEPKQEGKIRAVKLPVRVPGRPDALNGTPRTPLVWSDEDIEDCSRPKPPDPASERRGCYGPPTHPRLDRAAAALRVKQTVGINCGPNSIAKALASEAVPEKSPACGRNNVLTFPLCRVDEYADGIKTGVQIAANREKIYTFQAAAKRLGWSENAVRYSLDNGAKAKTLAQHNKERRVENAAKDGREVRTRDGYKPLGIVCKGTKVPLPFPTPDGHKFGISEADILDLEKANGLFRL